MTTNTNPIHNAQTARALLDELDAESDKLRQRRRRLLRRAREAGYPMLCSECGKQAGWPMRGVQGRLLCNPCYARGVR